MSEQRCGTCKWIRPALGGSENDYWICAYPKVPMPYINQMMLQMARNPRFRLLSVGDPESDFGKVCPTYEAKHE